MKTLNQVLSSAKNYSRASLAGLLVATTPFIFSGCESSSSDSYSKPKENVAIPGDWTNSKFEIVRPYDHEHTADNTIEVLGVGAVQGATIVLEAYTDRWYPEGNATIYGNGSFRGRVALGGVGKYNNHTIRATQYFSNGKVVDTVSGIVRD
jgi:hypothetical protein